MKPTVAAVLALLVLSPLPAVRGQSPRARYSVFEARNHIGETAGVRGIVTHVDQSRRGLVQLCFGSLYPSQDFTVVVPDPRAFGNLRRFRGCVLEVYGRIALFRGRPEIVMTSVSQLRFVEVASSAQVLGGE